MKRIKSTIFLITFVVLAIISVALYQTFYQKSIEIPEIIPTTANVQVINELNLGIYKMDVMNPIKSQNEQVQQLSRLVFESLFSISKDFRAEPSLAKEYTMLDEVTYIIKLRDDVLFHDNSIFNSTYVEQTIKQINSEKNSIYYNNIANIKNVKVIDESTIRLELYNKDQFFIYNLIFPIIKEENLGTGMYMLSEGGLKYYNNYWKQVKPSITKINVKNYDNMAQMYSDFKNGDLDIVNTKEEQYKTFLGEIGFNKKDYSGRKYTYLELNDINLEIRQAIYSSINKSEIISKVYRNQHFASEFPLDTANWLYKNSTTHKYDLDKSIQILENSNWEFVNGSWQKGKEKIELKLLIESMDTTKNEIAYILKNQLEKIGLNINLEKVSKNLYNSYLKNKKYDIIINTVNIGVSPNLTTFFKNSSTEDTLPSVENERKLIETYKQLEESYHQSLPFIVLSCNKQTLIYSEKLYGSVNPNWFNIFYDIENWKKLNQTT